MMNWVKLSCLLLAMAMLLSLAACAHTTGEWPEPTPEPQATETPAEIRELVSPEYPKEELLPAFERAGLDAFASRSLPVLFSELAGENRVYSPMNIYTALAMLAEVTDGSSREELLALLGYGSMEALRNDVKALWEASCREGDYLSVLPGASLWLRNDAEYKQEALDNLATYDYASAFSGTMGSEDYDRQLRDWVNERTKHLLERQAEGLSLPPDTLIALVTTLYFKGSWADEFPESLTEREPFHADKGDVETDFMHRTNETFYYRGADFGAIRLPMFGGAGMWLLLPDEDSSLQALIDGGEATALLCADGDWEDSVRAKVSISLPRFDIGGEFSLIEALQALGISAVFDPNRSDFSPLTEELGLSVTEAKHAARVKIDEKGCEAAAFTEIVVARSAAMQPELEKIDFICDRPFLFAVTGSEGQLLFIGAVNDPGK